MRELNEQELEQVAGGSFTFNYGTIASAGGDASAKHGYASSKSVTGSTLNCHGSSSFAANRSYAAGCGVSVDSGAQSSSGLTLSAS